MSAKEKGASSILYPLVAVGLFAALITASLSGCALPFSGQTTAPTHSWLVVPPPAGKWYMGAYPSIGSDEDAITPAMLQAFERAIGKEAAWVYFSDEWSHGRAFPLATATWIRARGRIPYIRLMLRSSNDQNVAEPVFTLERIARGDFDTDLKAWGRAAAAFGSPLMAEFGTEANGQWFSWNGYWHGQNSAGPRLFRTAYRHIIQTIRQGGARNITWVFHLNDDDDPQVAWNRFENYYPGDDVIDWVGVSVYGAQTPTDPPCPKFRDLFDSTYARIVKMTQKPILIAEIGTLLNGSNCDAPAWIRGALGDLLGNRWPAVRGFAWWNDWWDNGDTNNPAQISDLRLQDSPQAAAVWQTMVGRNAAVLDRVVVRSNI